MAKKNYDLLFKLLLIGDSGVGKVGLHDDRIRSNVSVSFSLSTRLDLYSLSFFRWFIQCFIHLHDRNWFQDQNNWIRWSKDKITDLVRRKPSSPSIEDDAIDHWLFSRSLTVIQWSKSQEEERIFLDLSSFYLTPFKVMNNHCVLAIDALSMT